MQVARLECVARIARVAQVSKDRGDDKMARAKLLAGESLCIYSLLQVSSLANVRTIYLKPV